jgi:hypothetical protein
VAVPKTVITEAKYVCGTATFTKFMVMLIVSSIAQVTTGIFKCSRYLLGTRTPWICPIYIAEAKTKGEKCGTFMRFKVTCAVGRGVSLEYQEAIFYLMLLSVVTGALAAPLRILVLL